jgi:mono/diheme cytochrome c family protein
MKLKILILALIFVAGASFTVLTQKEWPVPEKYNKMPNPLKGDVSSLSTAKGLWSKHCQSCHGKAGKGDGSKAAELKTTPEDLSKAKIQEQTDGAFFYKTLEGRDDMPSFKKKIPDQDDIWALVNYMRTFKK